MLGLDPEIAQHRLNIRDDTKPVIQQHRKFRPEMQQAIEAEVKKLNTWGFIHKE